MLTNLVTLREALVFSFEHTSNRHIEHCVMRALCLQQAAHTVRRHSIAVRRPPCCALSSAPVHVMPSKVLLAAQPELYAEQIGEKRKRIEGMFKQFNPPELQIYESEKQHYRMR